MKVDVAAVAQNGSSAAAPGRPASAGPSAGPGAVITAWVVIAVGALTGLTLWGQFTSGASTGMLILDVSVGVASCALMPVTLRWPVAGALALSVLAALSAAATPAATVAVLLVAQRRRFAVAVEVAVVGIVAHAIRGAWRPFSGLSYGWWLVLVVVAYAVLVGWGELTQARQAVIQSLRERAERAEAEQDRRLNEARARNVLVSPAKCMTCWPTGFLCWLLFPAPWSTGQIRPPNSCRVLPVSSVPEPTRHWRTCAK